MPVLQFPADPSTGVFDLPSVDAPSRQLVENAAFRFSGLCMELLGSGLALRDLEAFERELESVGREVCRPVLAAAIGSLDDGAPSVTRDGKNYSRVAPTPKTIQTSLGAVRFWRPRYRRKGEASLVPVDEALGLVDDDFTPLAGRRALLLMSGNTARECVTLCDELGGMQPSVSSLQRLTQEAASRREAVSGEALEEVHAGEVPEAAVTACVSLDGVMVPMRAGEAGQTAAGYREAGCGTVSFHDAGGERLKTLYFGRMPEGGKVSLKAQLRAEVASIARLRPDIRITTVADAAPDNWSFLSTLAPDAPQVIDFWHAAQHLRAAADAAFGADCGNGGKWFEKYRGILREQTRGIDKVIRALRYLCGKHPKARQDLKRELNFFRKHRHRMRYQNWADQNLPIGSGIVEAANRTLIAQRLKRSGQRWGKNGGQAVLSIRALVASNRFDAAWKAIVSTWKTPQNDNNSRKLLKSVA